MFDLDTYKIKVRYYISFVDGQGIPHEEEISFNVFTAFKKFEQENYRQQHFHTRHVEHADLTDREIYDRAINPGKGIDDEVSAKIRNEAMQKAISGLPEVQRRRFILYYEYDMTLEEIAKMEGCSFQAINRSVGIATKKIKEKIKNFYF